MEHIWITVVSVLLGVLIAFPLALLARRFVRLESTILGVSTGIYTIPSLALFPLLVPFTGLSPTTVVIGLALYALTVLVRAMLEGLRAVPEEVRESATGLGYGAGRLLFRVELPLALPVIMAGLRVATVSTVALTTVGSLVAYGGLGNLIKDGVNTNFRAELFTAAVLCVLLAVVLDVLIVLAQRLLTPWTRERGMSTPEATRCARASSGPRMTSSATPGTTSSTAPAGPVDGGMLDLLLQQLLLSVSALALAMLVGLPVALWLGHLGRGGFLAINISNIGRAVPTFALLAILVTADFPGRADFGPFGRAGLATLIALTLFALPPLITNSYVAVREVPADVRQAADGMGMTGAQKFLRVELPLALPLVMSGVRLALVQVWATATIAALVAGPGLGRVITDGFFRTNYGKGLAGAVVVALVALVARAAARRRCSAPSTRTRSRSAGAGRETRNRRSRPLGWTPDADAVGG